MKRKYMFLIGIAFVSVYVLSNESTIWLLIEVLLGVSLILASIYDIISNKRSQISKQIDRRTIWVISLLIFLITIWIIRYIFFIL